MTAAISNRPVVQLLARPLAAPRLHSCGAASSVDLMLPPNASRSFYSSTGVLSWVPYPRQGEPRWSQLAQLVTLVVYGYLAFTFKDIYDYRQLVNDEEQTLKHFRSLPSDSTEQLEALKVEEQKYRALFAWLQQSKMSAEELQSLERYYRSSEQQVTLEQILDPHAPRVFSQYFLSCKLNQLALAATDLARSLQWQAEIEQKQQQRTSPEARSKLIESEGLLLLGIELVMSKYDTYSLMTVLDIQLLGRTYQLLGESQRADQVLHTGLSVLQCPLKRATVEEKQQRRATIQLQIQTNCCAAVDHIASTEGDIKSSSELLRRHLQQLFGLAIDLPELYQHRFQSQALVSPFSTELLASTNAASMADVVQSLPTTVGESFTSDQLPTYLKQTALNVLVTQTENPQVCHESIKALCSIALDLHALHNQSSALLAEDLARRIADLVDMQPQSLLKVETVAAG